jgi:hypothetical protein
MAKDLLPGSQYSYGKINVTGALPWRNLSAACSGQNADNETETPKFDLAAYISNYKGI